jgi:hypothetical protein
MSRETTVLLLIIVVCVVLVVWDFLLSPLSARRPTGAAI